VTECWCCGEQPERLVGLLCHDEVKICSVCIRWLRANAGVIDATPILPVVDMAASIAFFRAAGFKVREYQDGGTYAFVTYDDESVFDIDQAEIAMTPDTNGAGCYLIVPDVDGWHARLHGMGHAVTDLVDEPWGMREFTLTDPSGNRIRFGRSIQASPPRAAGR
jgi:predicted enzyme related to lactoylglutathione lyase